MMELKRRHWFIALAGALLLHLAVAAVTLWQTPVVGASGSGVGGIEVSLGPAGGAPGSVAAQVAEAEESEPVEPEVAAEMPQPESVTVEPVEPAAVEAEPVVPEQPLDQMPPIETTGTPDAEQTDPVEAGTAAASEPVETVETEKPVPPIPDLRPRDLPEQAAEAQPVQEPQAEQRRPTEQPDAEPTQTAAAPSTAGAGGTAGIEDNREAASTGASSGGGDPGLVADYMARLQAWLERHKEYPRHAKQRRQEGTVMLYFVMDRDGRVIDYRVSESSGYDLLDRAVEEMIERAQPLPEMPAEMTQARLELIVPVQFFLR